MFVLWEHKWFVWCSSVVFVRHVEHMKKHIYSRCNFTWLFRLLHDKWQDRRQLVISLWSLLITFILNWWLFPVCYILSFIIFFFGHLIACSSSKFLSLGVLKSVSKFKTAAFLLCLVYPVLTYPLFIFSVLWTDSTWYWPAKADYGRGWSQIKRKKNSLQSPEGGVNGKLWELSPFS